MFADDRPISKRRHYNFFLDWSLNKVPASSKRPINKIYCCYYNPLTTIKKRLSGGRELETHQPLCKGIFLPDGLMEHKTIVHQLPKTSLPPLRGSDRKTDAELLGSGSSRKKYR